MDQQPDGMPLAYLLEMGTMAAKQNWSIILDGWKSNYGATPWVKRIVAWPERDSAYIILADSGLNRQYPSGQGADAFWNDIVAIENLMEDDEDELGEHQVEFPEQLADRLAEPAFWHQVWPVGPMRACKPLVAGGVRVPVLLVGKFDLDFDLEDGIRLLEQTPEGRALIDRARAKLGGF